MIDDKKKNFSYCFINDMEADIFPRSVAKIVSEILGSAVVEVIDGDMETVNLHAWGSVAVYYFADYF